MLINKEIIAELLLNLFPEFGIPSKASILSTFLTKYSRDS